MQDLEEALSLRSGSSKYIEHDNEKEQLIIEPDQEQRKLSFLFIVTVQIRGR